MTRLFLTALLAGTMLAGAATAQTPPTQDGGGRGTMRADTDGDGRISRAEAIAESDARFARMDANGDGKLCGDENRRRGRRDAQVADAAAPPPPPTSEMAKPAADGDACVSRDEFHARAMRRFDRLDTNHDGLIDAAEMQAMSDRMMRMREQRRSGDMPPPPPPSPQDPGQ